MKFKRLPALKTAAAILLLGFLIARLDNRADLVHAFRQAAGRPGWILLGFGLFGVSLLCFFLRWRRLLVALGVFLPNGRILRLTFLGHAGNLLLPGGTGGDLLKAGCLLRDGSGHRSAALFSLLLDRLTGLYWMMVLVLVVSWHGWGLFADSPLLRLVLVINALGVMIGMILFWVLRRFHPTIQTEDSCRGIRKRFFSIWNAAHFFCRNPGVLRDTAFYSLANHWIQVACAACMIRAVGSPLRLPEALTLLPIANLITMIPMTPGALGVREAAFRFVLETVGVPAATALTASLLQFGIMAGWAVLAVPTYWFSRTRNNCRQDESSGLQGHSGRRHQRKRQR